MIIDSTNVPYNQTWEFITKRRLPLCSSFIAKNERKLMIMNIRKNNEKIENIITILMKKRKKNKRGESVSVKGKI